MSDEADANPDGGPDEGLAQAPLFTVAEASRRLGVTPQAIRDRIKRGTLETVREVEGNRARLLVRLLPNVGPSPDEGLEQRLEQRLLEALDRRLEAVLTQGLIKELRERVAAADAERDRALDQAGRLRDELERERAARRWPGLRRWWRRFVEGEG